MRYLEPVGAAPILNMGAAKPRHARLRIGEIHPYPGGMELGPVTWALSTPGVSSLPGQAA